MTWNLLLLGVLFVPFWIVMVYLTARVASYAYFQSLRGYERSWEAESLDES